MLAFTDQESDIEELLSFGGQWNCLNANLERQYISISFTICFE